MSEKVEASQKTPRGEENGIPSILIKTGQEIHNYLEKHPDYECVKNHEWVEVEGLVAELQKLKSNEHYGVFPSICPTCSRNKTIDEVLVLLGVEDLTLTNVEATKFPDGSMLTRKDYSPKKKN